MNALRIVFWVLLFGFNTLCFSQNAKYDSLVYFAQKSFYAGNYKLASTQFHDAFGAFGGKGVAKDRYHAAISWAMIEQKDSAFFNLFRLAEKTTYLEYNVLVNEKRLNNLKSDTRWEKLLLLVNPRGEIYNDSLANILTDIYDKDQKYRHLLDGVRQPYGSVQSDSFNTLLHLINYNDSINQIKVLSIIDKYGWLSKNEVGSKGNSALWLVIQHADLMIQMKYFPVMQDAVKNGKASIIDLAYLEDRILMRQGKKQLYGTQYKLNNNTHLMELWEIEDPENLNKRRRSIGLSDM